MQKRCPQVIMQPSSMQNIYPPVTQANGPVFNTELNKYTHSEKLKMLKTGCGTFGISDHLAWERREEERQSVVRFSSTCVGTTGPAQLYGMLLHAQAGTSFRFRFYPSIKRQVHFLFAYQLKPFWI